MADACEQVALRPRVAGRVGAILGCDGPLTAEDVELAFARMRAEVAHGWTMDRESVATPFCFVSWPTTAGLPASW